MHAWSQEQFSKELGLVLLAHRMVTVTTRVAQSERIPYCNSWRQRRPRVFEKWTHNEAFKYMFFFVLTMNKKYFNEKLLPQEKS